MEGFLGILTQPRYLATEAARQTQILQEVCALLAKDPGITTRKENESGYLPLHAVLAHGPWEDANAILEMVLKATPPEVIREHNIDCYTGRGRRCYIVCESIRDDIFVIDSEAKLLVDYGVNCTLQCQRWDNPPYDHAVMQYARARYAALARKRTTLCALSLVLRQGRGLSRDLVQFIVTHSPSDAHAYKAWLK